jgi:ABC-type uncharacterized transport system permease subunit
METLATIGFSLGVIGYSIASTLFFSELTRRPGPGTERPAAGVLGLGAAMHLVHIVAASLFSRICPVESVHFALSLTALVTVLLFLLVRRGRRLDALGVVVGPLALAFLVASQFVGPTPTHPGVSRALLALHITASMLGFGVVMLAGAAAGFYLVVERRLKAKRFSEAGKLPSLESLDRVGHRLLLLGFPLLTFAVVTGGMFVARLQEMTGASFARAVLGYATWALVAGVLLLRALGGWRGRRTAYGTLAGLACLALVLAVYVLRPWLGGLT